MGVLVGQGEWLYRGRLEGEDVSGKTDVLSASVGTSQGLTE